MRNPFATRIYLFNNFVHRSYDGVQHTIMLIIIIIITYYQMEWIFVLSSFPSLAVRSSLFSARCLYFHCKIVVHWKYCICRRDEPGNTYKLNIRPAWQILNEEPIYFATIYISFALSYSFIIHVAAH